MANRNFQPTPEQRMTNRLSKRSQANLRAKQARRELDYARASYARYTVSYTPSTRSER